MVVRSIRSGFFFTVEPCLEYYFAWEVTVDVCLHASKANKCASVSGKPFYYVKKCLIYTSRDSHAGCFWMSASAKKVITIQSTLSLICIIFLGEQSPSWRTNWLPWGQLSRVIILVCNWVWPIVVFNNINQVIVLVFHCALPIVVATWMKRVSVLVCHRAWPIVVSLKMKRVIVLVSHWAWALWMDSIDALVEYFGQISIIS